MNLIRTLAGGRKRPDGVAVKGVSVAQGPNARCSAPLGSIVGPYEGSQLQVGGTNLVVDRGHNGIAKPRLIGRRYRVGKLERRLSERISSLPQVRR